MSGKKGQKNPSKHRRENQWTTGSAEAIRESEVFAFKVEKSLYPRVKQEIEERGISKQQFVDDLLACYYGLDQHEEIESDSELREQRRVEVGELSSVLTDAIGIAIATKQAALRAEKKQKRPDQAQMKRWQAQIEELEALISE